MINLQDIKPGFYLAEKFYPTPPENEIEAEKRIYEHRFIVYINGIPPFFEIFLWDHKRLKTIKLNICFDGIFRASDEGHMYTYSLTIENQLYETYIPDNAA